MEGKAGDGAGSVAGLVKEKRVSIFTSVPTSIFISTSAHRGKLLPQIPPGFCWNRPSSVLSASPTRFPLSVMTLAANPHSQSDQQQIL